MARSRVIGIGKAVARNRKLIGLAALALLVFGPLLRGAGVEGFALNLIGLGFAGLVVRGVLVKRMQLREPGGVSAAASAQGGGGPRPMAEAHGARGLAGRRGSSRMAVRRRLKRIVG